MNKLTDEELYKLAKKRTLVKKSFKIHFNIYLMVSIILFFISIYNNSFWFIFPVVGWGIGLLIHKISVNSFLNSNEDIKKEFDLLKKIINIRRD